jgi:outer membrane protein OmpA-like peptidoglycan-associated protein
MTLAACATVPDRNAALDRARDSFDLAQHNSQISTLATDELKRAGESLRVAERAWNQRQGKATVDHLAYMTSQQVAVAEETASSRASQAITTSAAADRDKMRLELRTAEANAAQRQLEVSQQSNIRKTNELAKADAYADRNRVQLSESTAEGDRARQQLALSKQSEALKSAELAKAAAAAKLSSENMARSSARVSDLEAQLEQLNAKETDRGMVVTLSDVLFDTGKSKLLPGGSGNMTKLADFFKSHPESKASIEGHTDSVGAASSNYALSQRRADSVMAALVALGVPADHLTTRAYGADTPVSDNSTAAGRQMNRRVEIVIAPTVENVSMN